ncbi:hypothetical protein CDAR_491351 [Caerostris darwini]|uniref:Reverse transcriptase domain-containing protein n=1 Tax=Caerostris darwini TaxID=1538125 RepID=A0AAV4XAH5_9ARAC|nr:hypothetical protein CDAR_491351 [Caerostris darwini]
MIVPLDLVNETGIASGICLLCPLLFNLINDFVDSLCTRELLIQSLLFADDLVIWTEGGDSEFYAKNTPISFSFLERWSVENEMTVNPETAIQLFSLSTKHYDINLRFRDQLLKRIGSSAYLGLDLDVNWTGQIKKAVDRG